MVGMVFDAPHFLSTHPMLGSTRPLWSLQNMSVPFSPRSRSHPFTSDHLQQGPHQKPCFPSWPRNIHSPSEANVTFQTCIRSSWLCPATKLPGSPSCLSKPNSSPGLAYFGQPSDPQSPPWATPAGFPSASQSRTTEATPGPLHWFPPLLSLISHHK